MPQRGERKALPEDGGRPQRRALTLRQPVDARQHEAVQRRRQAVVALLGGAQQLLQKQRIAAGALDAFARERRRRREEAAGKRHGIRVGSGAMSSVMSAQPASDARNPPASGSPSARDVSTSSARLFGVARASAAT